MKTFTSLILMLFVLSNANSFGQINPVRNLSYQQWYDLGNFNCPGFNCFALSWQVPDSTRDTLVGYKIYRNDSFYTFVSWTGIGCSGFMPCDYNDWYSMMPFWVTVKAIYNHDSLESVARDSVEVGDFLINIKEKEKQNFSLLKNPINAGDNISIVNSSSSLENLVIQIVSLKGQTLRQFKISNSSKSVIFLPSTNLEKGLYFIDIGTKEQKIPLKLLIQ